jgi:hypothetical protein
MGIKGGRQVMLTTLPPSVSRLPRKCETVDVSQTYGLLRRVTGIDLPYLFITYVSSPNKGGMVTSKASWTTETIKRVLN